MAQQASNIQREPSMDEILASIRRIIEESEPDRAKADLSALEELTAEPTVIAAPANDAARNKSLLGAAEPVEALRPSIPAVELQEEVVQMEDELLSPSFDADALSLDADLESAFLELDVAPQASGDLDIPTIDPEPIAAQAHLSDVLSVAMTRPVSEAARSIISEHTGRQVAASFGDLADAFSASRRRSFDEVAEEMMRPMLQDWMDNNLPMLVERLVREEIERVARGG